ncbi:MAG: TolC family protein [Bradymonadales bacterium]|nr:MAG: TolC family protein [Bradymonadales bacterium]
MGLGFLKKKNTKKLKFARWGVSLGFIVAPLQAPVSGLSLSEYLEQVESQSRQLLQAEESRMAALERRSEADRVFAPRLVATGRYFYEKESGQSGFRPQGSVTRGFEQSVGLEKKWSSGTLTRFRAASSRKRMEGFPSLDDPFWNNFVELGLEQPILGNRLGLRDRALRRRGRAVQEAEALRQSFQSRLLMLQAEQLYWALALAQERLDKIRESLQRTRAILDWNKRRFDLNLIDRGDLYQSEAAVLQLKQNLESAERLQRDIRREFEEFRRSNEFESELELETLSLKVPDLPTVGEWPQFREDLQAVQTLSRAAEAEKEISRSATHPDLFLFGNFRSASFGSRFSGSQSQVFELKHPSYEFGLQFQLPLDFGNLARLRSAADRDYFVQRQEEARVEEGLHRELVGLKDRLDELLAKLKVQEDLIEIQRKKLAHEDSRFRQGRSTSFQILTFEEDLSNAELQLLEFYADLRMSLAELRLFSEDSGSSLANY